MLRDRILPGHPATSRVHLNQQIVCATEGGPVKYLFLSLAVLLLMAAAPAIAQVDVNQDGYYGQPQASRGVLSPDDQAKFDSYYAKWVSDTRRNDRDDIAKDAGHMQEIMARYNIPPNTPFQAIATNGYTAGAYPGPNPAYAYPYGQPQRLSAKDQKDFDNAYKHWVDARRKRDMDDVDKNERKMQGIMARYNIPANVPFDQIATAGSAYRH